MDEHLSYIQVVAGSRPARRTENTVGGCVEEEFQSPEHIIYACTQYEQELHHYARKISLSAAAP